MKRIFFLLLFSYLSSEKIFSQCYSVDSIAYSSMPFTGTQLPAFIDDDSYSGLIPIGFSFCFYGGIYSQVAIGANAIISFNLTDDHNICYWAIGSPVPNASDNNNNSVMFPWQDLDEGGNVTYAQYGTAPNRSFVVSFDSVPMFSISCASLLFTGQAILYETSNIIEIYIKNKAICTTFNGGKAIEGVQNKLHNMAVTVPGRNATQWTAINDAWRFTPTCNVCSGVGINEMSDSNSLISLSPNPATNELRIENLPANGNGSAQWQAGAELRIREIEIYNMLGEKRLTPTLSKGEGVRVDVSSLPAGVYFVAVTDDKGNKITKRFIKM